MAFMPSSGGRPRRSVPRKAGAAPLDEDRERLERTAAEVRRLEEELRRKAEAAEQQLAELPKKIAEKRRRELENMRIRLALDATTADGLIRPRRKKFEPVGGTARVPRKTLGEERAARFQFLLLCGVLLIMAILLVRSIPHG